MVVVGRFVGSAALAAVGSNGALINLLVNLFVGLALGANVVAARCYGAKDDQGVHEAVQTAVTLSLVGGVLMAFVGFFAAHGLLELMSSPELKDWGYEVIEGKLAIADVMKAAEEGKLEEVFGTGTAAVVSPVKELDWEGKVANISGGKIGPLTQKLYDTLTGIQWGKLPDTKGWTVKVEPKV